MKNLSTHEPLPIKRYLDISKTKVKYDLTYKRFGNLTVLGYLGMFDNKKSIWEAKCDCGNIIKIQTGALKRQKSCGCMFNYNRKEKGESAFNRILEGYKKSAEKRGLVFELTKEQFKRLIDSNCILCNTPPKNEYRAPNINGSYIYNGIDRVDNNIGYIYGNCVTLCKMCNFAKKDSKLDDFYSWINRLVEFRNNDGQPLPISNDHPFVIDLVEKDFQERKRLGFLRYRKILQPFNGRNALIDLYQELLDAVVYLRQLIYEDEHNKSNNFSLHEENQHTNTKKV